MKNIQAILEKVRHKIIEEEDIRRVVTVLKSGFLSKPEGGPMVEKFQKQMANMHQQKYAFAVNSGTSALHCAISALELKNQEEVIIPALSNIADCSTIIQEGGTPVFVDIDENTFNIDPQKIEEKITSKTRAIIVVHMYGQPANMDQLLSISKKHNLTLIEDCAQSAGARYEGKYVGSFGDITCFSLYQTKHIICGEGGVVMTRNNQYAKIITSIANNGIIKERLEDYDYDYDRIGYNYQLSEIQAALGIGQLKRLDQNNIERRKNVEKYKHLLSNIDIQFQTVSPETENSYFYLTALLPEKLSNKRNEFLSIVTRLGAPIKKLYPLSIPEFTLFKDVVVQDCPIANKITKRMFNFYVNPGLKDTDIKFIAEVTKEAFQKIS